MFSNTLGPLSVIACEYGWRTLAPPERTRIWGIDRSGQLSLKDVHVEQTNIDEHLVAIATEATFCAVSESSLLLTKRGRTVRAASLVKDEAAFDTEFEQTLAIPITGLGDRAPQLIWTSLAQAATAFADGHLLFHLKNEAATHTSSGVSFIDGKTNETYARLARESIPTEDLWTFLISVSRDCFSSMFGFSALTFGAWALTAYAKNRTGYRVTADSMQSSATFRIEDAPALPSPINRLRCLFLRAERQPVYRLHWNLGGWSPLIAGILLGSEAYTG